MFQLFLEPLQYDFMQRSLIVAVLVGVLCAVVGSYLMVQRLALLGDAISHSVMPGLALAFAIEANIFIGAFIAGILSTLLIALIHTRSPIKEDTAMGIVFSAFFALGITLITMIQKDNKVDLNHFLFGNILGVSWNDVINTMVIATIVVLVIILLFKELQFYTFDPLGAQAAGLPVNLLNFGLMILIALTIVASLKVVGVILVLALLVTPGATAYLLVQRLHQMMLLGSAISVISSVSGMYLSYYFNLPSGPAVVLVSASFFTLAFLFSPQHGLLTNSQPSKTGSALIREIKSLLGIKRSP
ncbi:ABC-type Mn2+/Zn2+ transport system, permease component [Leptolyngbyaceae cyanobacterium JSC-12]|nr:ABC-type Mn2+/Zn2+ transport system, permease component [Leptolyngbyaceae cyanobacterium JSC-12]